MHKFPDSIQTILNTISHCAKQNDVKVFLRGDLVLYALTGNSDFIQEQKIDLVISYDQSFDTHQLYQCLIQHIIVNKEVENSGHRYHIISAGYEIRIDLIHQFDPTRLVQVQSFGSFNLNLLFVNLETEELRHPPEVSGDPGFLKNIHNKNNWSFEDVLGFVYWNGTLQDIKIDEDQYGYLRLLSLGTLKESLDITWEEQIETILLLRRSGAALDFISKTFADGMSWTFKVLIDYMISMSVGINEDSNIETVFNEKKFELVDLYNDFFLGDKKVKETADDVHHRLTTILKLLFDSPNLSIPRPYINAIQAMAGGASGRCCLGSKIGGNVTFFGCGNDIDELDCALPIDCPAGSNECLREHPSFAHIPDANWDLITVDRREWCPDQICPAADNIHCLTEVTSSSSSMFLSSSSSSSSSSSMFLSSSSSSQSSSSSSSKSSSSSSESSSSSSSSESSSSSSESLFMANTLRQIIQGSGTITDVAEFDITITDDGGMALLDVTKAFCFFQMKTDTDEGSHTRYFSTVWIINTTTIRIQRSTDAQGNFEMPYTYYLIEFDSASDIVVEQSLLSLDIDDGVANEPATNFKDMNTVDLSESMLISQGSRTYGVNGTTLTGSRDSQKYEFDDYGTSWKTTTEFWAVFSADTEEHRVQIIDWGDDGVFAQQGTFTFDAATKAFDSFSPPIAVDPTRTLLFVTYSRTGNTSTTPNILYSIAAHLNYAGEIEVLRYSDVGSSDFLLSWQLIEFPASFMSVQHILAVIPEDFSTTASIDIDPVDTDRSFVTGTIGTFFSWGSGTTSGGSPDTHWGKSTVLFDGIYNDQVLISNKDTTDDFTIGFQVVEFLN